MFEEELGNLESWDVELVSNTEPNAKRQRCNPNKKWTVDEEKALVEFLMENRSFEKPTAQMYYKCFIDKLKMDLGWKVARSKVRNMRTAYNKAKTWESSTGAGTMNGETIKATLLKKCHFFDAFDELFGPTRLANNVVIEDSLDDPSLQGDILNSTEIGIDETTTSSVGYESGQSRSRKGIYSRTGVSDIMDMHSEMMKMKKDKIERDMVYKDREMQIKEQEVALKQKEIELKQKKIESNEKLRILEMEMKERLAMEELKLKYKVNSGNQLY